MKWIVSTVFIILTIFGSFVAGYSTLEAEVGRNSVIIKEVQATTVDLEIDRAGKNEMLNQIKEDVSEIKKDIKQLLRENR